MGIMTIKASVTVAFTNYVLLTSKLLLLDLYIKVIEREKQN